MGRINGFTSVIIINNVLTPHLVNQYNTEIASKGLRLGLVWIKSSNQTP